MRRWPGTSSGSRRSDATVLIYGESGTGKELVAHVDPRGRAPGATAPSSPSMRRPCPESLAESELFGHEKGAFTGAVASRPGRFELAQGGTLFLDEIGTLSPGVQAKLLRVLESREIERVGGRRPIPVDFRLISATNEDLEARVAAGSFREDLFYRINTMPLRIPPLRERGEDIPLLAEHFLASRRHAAPQARPAAVCRRVLRAPPGPPVEGQRPGARSTSSRCSSSSPKGRRDRRGGPAQGAPRGPAVGRGRRGGSQGLRLEPSRTSSARSCRTRLRRPAGSRRRPRAGSASMRTRSSTSAGSMASESVEKFNSGRWKFSTGHPLTSHL